VWICPHLLLHFVKSPRCLTQSSHETEEKEAAPISSLRENIPSKTYASLVALVSSIHEPSIFLEANSLMEECYFWQTLVDFETTTGTILEVAALVEL
jgi:hypothetical protein